MKNSILGPSSFEWFNFGPVELSSTKDSIVFRGEKETITLKLKNSGAKFNKLPEKHSGSNVSTVQRVKVTQSKSKSELRQLTSEWEIVFDDKTRTTFETFSEGKSKFEVPTTPVKWEIS